jgi:Fanconi anemia group M protein
LDLKIVVDSREYSKQRRIVDMLESYGVKVLVEELEGGDYCVQGEFLIERKTPVDLVKSVKTGRIWEQAKKLKSAVDVRPLILIEGYPTSLAKFTDWNVASYHSVQLALIFGWEIPIYYTPNWRWTADFLIQLARRAAEEGKVKIYPVGFKPHADTPQEMKRRVVESLPGIGPKQALELLRHFGTVKNIVNATVSELREVRGIGEKKAMTIYQTVNDPYLEEIHNIGSY